MGHKFKTILNYIIIGDQFGHHETLHPYPHQTKKKLNLRRKNHHFFFFFPLVSYKGFSFRTGGRRGEGLTQRPVLQALTSRQ